MIPKTKENDVNISQKPSWIHKESVQRVELRGHYITLPANVFAQVLKMRNGQIIFIS